MGVVLELAEGKDAQPIIDFMNVAAGESDNLSFGVGEFMLQQADDEAAFLQRQRELGGFTLLAWNQVKGGPKLVGLLSVDRGDRPRTAHRAQLAMAVQRDLWGEGVGSRMLELAMRKLEDDQGVEIAHLEVRCGNERAIRLYERFGFEKTGVDRGVMKVDGELVDAYLMSRQFVRAVAFGGGALAYMRDVLDVIEQQDEEWTALVNKATGEVGLDYSGSTFDDSDWMDEDVPDYEDPNWVCLPSPHDMDDWHCMQSFARQQDDAHSSRLLDALHSRHGYRRFKDCAADSGLLRAYFSYRDEWRRGIAIDWLDANGIAWTDGRRVE